MADRHWFGVSGAHRQRPQAALVIPPGAKPPDLEQLRQRVARIEERLRASKHLSEKLQLQAGQSNMRSQLTKGRDAVNASYPLNPPYSFANIRFDAQAGEFAYRVLEPPLRAGEEEIVERIKQRMESAADKEAVPVVAAGRASDDPAMQDFLRRKFDFVVDLYDIPIPEGRDKTLYYYIQRDLVGLGRADAVLRDPFVEDISCNGHGLPIYVFHRVFGSVRTNVTFGEELELNRYIQKLAQVAGKHVSIYQPILDATLQDGSRINLTLGTEVTRRGSTFSIRKFSQDPITPVDLLRLGSVGAEPMAFLWHLIQHKRSILVSGGTASGKTTLLNALSMFMRPEDKVVSIEDTAEIHLAHTNWIQSVSRAGFGNATGAAGGARPGAITLFDLLVAALRQRPEYVLVGEVRGREASTLFQAIATGHAAMATIHAGSVEELLHRMESDPMNIPRALLGSLDAVVFPAQVLRGSIRLRRLRGITEILGVDPATENLLTSDPYSWDPETDQFRFNGRSFVLERIAAASGKSLDSQFEELRSKTQFLQLVQRAGVSDFREFTRHINAYDLDPAAARAELEAQAKGA